ncbi:Spx/MgsR family RNA polymerase-binding regulatory protein [Psychrobacter sp. APC 3279]|uniref:Spx/MgsR family RNA polymerase-binding regulatory protein n=1 Tax=Psychrobacter sp. APC 3279 TaxID=3035189 RepID=UPI0025B4A119|nr:Spx/MgsR family RNA polymerase-binding regulatory protein [Psychrobacter sp. APC 3279]MDN3441553.1 Spx/MgsR family RNA polymerase-binding regulatory protein [Psychrobacter sp. APC 3279]
MTITIYGIKSCSTMKKAFTKLNDLDVSYDFHDYKKQGIEKETVQRWVNELGIEKVLNKRGTTWRKLDDSQKQAADANVDNAIDLLVENTSMIKRPIVEGQLADRDQAVLLCGFDEAEFDKAFS